MPESQPGGAYVRAGNNNDQTRQHNLSMVLTAVHHDGMHSRAALTERLRLNRSTIADLVGELVERGLVIESLRTDKGAVGRPGYDVRADDRVAVITVNPDLDAVIVAVVGLGGVLHRRVRYETDHVPSVREVVNVVRAVVEGMRSELETQYRIVGVGAAVPGLVNSDTGTVTLAPHLGWRDTPFAELLAEALGYPAVAINDANAGLLAESIYGAGRGVSDLIYINGSASGIGGGVLVGGSPLRGAQGYGAELGHIRVHGTGAGDGLRQCHCGRIGCLETEVRLDALTAILGVEQIDMEELHRALQDNVDPVLCAEITRQLTILTAALTDLVSIFNPKLMVVGGFLGALFALDPEQLQQEVRDLAFTELALAVRIEPAELRSRQLILGAAEIAFRSLLADPAGQVSR